MKKINIFDSPQYYRNYLINAKLLNKSKMKKFDGKSLVCVFFTTYCGVGCPFCFFHSPNFKNCIDRSSDVENHFSSEAVDKFIKFANDSNVGYLQISGGGEPFLEFKAILKCLENTKAERIILVTSGSWASDKVIAEKYVNELYNSTLKNLNNPRVTIRLSVSKYHSIKLKEKPLINLIEIFKNKFKENERFTLQIKIFEKDDTLEKYLKEYFPKYKIKLLQSNGTDDEKYIKIIPWKYVLKLDDYNLIVGKSRIFNSNLRPDIYNKKEISKNCSVYDKDIILSQNDFPSIINNSNGKIGLDWIVEYNGNVCTWQNRVQDNLLNIYEDSYDYVYKSTLNDILTYSFIDKGSKYREKILMEVSPKTVKLMKSVNIRDYAGTLAFEDEKIRLYYTIRVIQDYMIENKINKSMLDRLPKTLIKYIKMNKNQLIKEYKNSKYSILDQELSLPLDEKNFHDFLELIKLGHFELSEYDVKKAIKIYNNISAKNICSIDEIMHENDINVDRRLTKRLMKRKTIKDESKEMIFYLFRHGETNWNIENRIKGQMEDLKTVFTNKGNNQIDYLKNIVVSENLEAFFTSDLFRTMQTTSIINENLNLPVYYYKNFRGLNMGIFEGKTMSVFLKNKKVKKAFTNYNYPIPGGESINELNCRFIDGLNAIYNNYNYKKVAIISHGAAISNIKSKISGDTYEDIDFCIIKCYNNTYKVLSFGKYK